ncbi:class I SAM-dependent methyltransferase [Methylacidimicrobium tartarophylax]|uniref:class I SAM-dependent methyltransferase n=1 Tax=Methylacidimicrobium tartarophylax TaxID=1041768 RepID=UPI001FE32757|nr:class I SAM-dependent methyltransferase [Methylacidimicrobium tartarophylax]
MADFYSQDYHTNILEFESRKTNAVSRFWREKATELLLSIPIGKGSPPPLFAKAFPGFLWRFKELGLNLHSRILDYGCGRGHFLFRLREWGFRNLFGVDPFYHGQDMIEEGISLKKGDYTLLGESFDLIILNHVIEHLEEPLAILRTLKERLTPTGTILVSTPIADSYGWRKFGNSWAMWDPPRHLHVFTAKAMALAAGRAGLQIAKVEYDAGKNLWATSQFFALHPEQKTPISQEELTRRQKPIRRWMRLLDEIGDSDMATFYLVLRPDNQNDVPGNSLSGFGDIDG